MKTEFNKMKKNTPTGEEADSEEEQDNSGEVAGGESLHRSRVKTVSNTTDFDLELQADLACTEA